MTRASPEAHGGARKLTMRPSLNGHRRNFQLSGAHVPCIVARHFVVRCSVRCCVSLFLHIFGVLYGIDRPCNRAQTCANVPHQPLGVLIETPRSVRCVLFRTRMLLLQSPWFFTSTIYEYAAVSSPSQPTVTACINTLFTNQYPAASTPAVNSVATKAFPIVFTLATNPATKRVCRFCDSNAPSQVCQLCFVCRMRVPRCSSRLSARMEHYSPRKVRVPVSVR
jgi:hypothetical protein